MLLSPVAAPIDLPANPAVDVSTEPTGRLARARPSPWAAMPVVKVVVVQNDDAARKSLADMVAGFGYHVVTAAGVVQAKRLIEVERPVAVLLDLALPDAQTGLGLARWLRNRFGPTIVMIVVTGGLAIVELEAAERAWADFVLTKPVDLDQLMAILLPVRVHTSDATVVE